MFDSIMPATAAVAAAAAGPQARFPPTQYLSGRGPCPATAFVGTSAYPAPPFMAIQQTSAFASPSPPTSATQDASTLQATAALVTVARGASTGAVGASSANTAGTPSAEALDIFDTGQRIGVGNPGDAADINTATWEDCKVKGPAYLTASAAALMGLYASVSGVANSNAIVAPSAAGAQLFRSSAGSAGGIFYAREILVS